MITLKISEQEFDQLWEAVCLIQKLPNVQVAIFVPREGGMYATFTKEMFLKAITTDPTIGGPG